MPEQPNGQNIARVYSEQAKSYIDFAPTSFSWQFIEKPAFDRHLRDLCRPQVRVLDAGCGSGRIIEHLINNGIQPDNVTGVDISQNMLDEARKKLPEVKLIQADLVDADLPTNHFDLITAAMVFHYLDEEGLKRMMANFHKWLKSDGVLFYVTTHPIRIVNDNLSLYQKRGWRNEKTPWGSETPFFHRTTADFINETISAGFTIDMIDEPDVAKEGERTNPEEYSKYTSFGASRLVVRARKV
ncbi:class I SAM-dependent methyltransferase [Candidatus Curtissbacteria bacterium]|nr:class I SAM-dependent methyltransferase [Candidatus Curtissbacteria bacterium]